MPNVVDSFLDMIYNYICCVKKNKSDLANKEEFWAIGTGKTATPDDANNAIAAIRGVIGEAYGQDAARQIRIQYGGSVKASNAKELFSMPEIDGALVGGASLKPEEFAKIIKYDTVI